MRHRNLDFFSLCKCLINLPPFGISPTLVAHGSQSNARVDTIQRKTPTGCFFFQHYCSKDSFNRKYRIYV